MDNEEQPAPRLLLPSLDDVPAHTALILRDLIIGLEAEAGTARAKALSLEHELADVRFRYRGHLATLREELDRRARQVDLLRDECEQLSARLQAAEEPVAALPAAAPATARRAFRRP